MPDQLSDKEKVVAVLVTKLERIARKNKDEFRYTIYLHPDRNGLRYHFVCTETADGHDFIDSSGPSIEEACSISASALAEACKHWGYKNV